MLIGVHIVLPGAVIALTGAHTVLQVHSLHWLPLCYRCTHCADRCIHYTVGALIVLIGACIVLAGALIVLIGHQGYIPISMC